MARVTLTFEDVVGGPNDGGVHIFAELDPLIAMRDGLPIEDMTLAQTQAFFAYAQVDKHFESVTTTEAVTRPAE